ncbi:MAG: hypothetical protein ISS16_00340 [Ignavibacteria bacterium]|nr:hypothetical protein [Bacteroidota bacterium]MBL7127414.1 hypothetical protein [Ignavibacteria bacterium]
MVLENSSSDSEPSDTVLENSSFAEGIPSGKIERFLTFLVSVGDYSFQEFLKHSK